MNSEAEGVGTFSESAHSRLRLKKKKINHFELTPRSE